MAVTEGAAVGAGVAEAGFTVAGVRADGVCEGWGSAGPPTGAGRPEHAAAKIPQKQTATLRRQRRPARVKMAPGYIPNRKGTMAPRMIPRTNSVPASLTQ